jgi:uncharacterized protein YkwD
MGRIPAAFPGFVVAAVCAAVIAFAASQAPARAVVDCDTGEAALNAAELEMFDLINAARAGEGLSPLILSPGLNRTAAWKSEDRSAWGTTPSDPLFNHRDSLGRFPTERAHDCGFPKDAAENIAYGWGSVTATFNAWMASSGHRANILMSYYVTIGLGEHNDRWTTNFGIYNDNAAAPAPAPVPAAPVHSKPAPVAAPPPPSELALATGTTRVTYDGPAGWSSDVFASLGSALDFVYTWDAANQRWLRYVPGQAPYVNSLAWLEPGVEIVIGVNAAGTWDY